ncbi:hypothetical protein IQ255_24395 [Pleurocapsales cyanobacterium LEGE 10410]|nr:hypothetical protein [Pleurocapsales cyanobacterium LEGE 10410]
MSNCRNLANRLVISLAVVILTSLFITPAIAITQDLQLTSATGYRIETTFSYDDAITEIVQEQGTGTTNVLNSLTVSFYDPSGEMIASYDNIVDGVATGNYFEFNFDPATQQLIGKIDLGGESAGEMYLKGETDQDLSLIQVAESGEEKVIDRVN